MEGGEAVTRRIVLRLADDTTDTHCGSCPVNVRTPGICFRFNLYLDGATNPRRLDSCRSAELRPETVEEIRGALGEVAASRMTYEGEERTMQASADFERLFGGET